MPKMKTRKSLAKRVKVSAGGKLLFKRPGRGHLLSSKSRKRKRHLRNDGVVTAADEKRLMAML